MRKKMVPVILLLLYALSVGLFVWVFLASGKALPVAVWQALLLSLFPVAYPAYKYIVYRRKHKKVLR